MRHWTSFGGGYKGRGVGKGVGRKKEGKEKPLLTSMTEKANFIFLVRKKSLGLTGKEGGKGVRNRGEKTNRDVTKSKRIGNKGTKHEPLKRRVQKISKHWTRDDQRKKHLQKFAHT